jgi:hypothetical protein
MLFGNGALSARIWHTALLRKHSLSSRTTAISISMTVDRASLRLAPEGQLATVETCCYREQLGTSEAHKCGGRG